jgi:hypothetical protein
MGFTTGFGATRSYCINSLCSFNKFDLMTPSVVCLVAVVVPMRFFGPLPDPVLMCCIFC